MAFVDDRARPEMGHHIILEEREQLVVSGVEEVESFDESTILLTAPRAPAAAPRARGGWRCRGRGCTVKSCPWTAAT